MASHRPLAPEALYTECRLDHMQFDTTDDLEDSDEFLGQDRVLKAIDLGVTIKRKGYNICALGPTGVGKHTLVRGFVEGRAAREPARMIGVMSTTSRCRRNRRRCEAPPGTGVKLKHDMEQLIGSCRAFLGL